MSRHANHTLQRVVLPNGESIDVVRFADAQTDLPRGLHVCHECDSELMQPVAWSECGDGRWELVLRCPNCARCAAGFCAQRQLEDFEERLEEGLAKVLGDLKRLAHANMAEQIDRFVAALDADLVLPEDF